MRVFPHQKRTRNTVLTVRCEPDYGPKLIRFSYILALFFQENSAAATGGSDSQWQTIAQLIYKAGWKDLDLGYAAAMSWALFLIILVIAGVNAFLTNRLGGGKR